MWRSYSCHFCSGLKNVEIGNEHTDELIEIIPCPCCNGEGYLKVGVHPYEESQFFWKRMGGNGGLL